MKVTPSKLQTLLNLAREVQSVSLNDDTDETAPLGFSTRVTAQWLSQRSSVHNVSTLLSRYGLGLALLLLMASGALFALSPPEQLTEEELLVARISQILFSH